MVDGLVLLSKNGISIKKETSYHSTSAFPHINHYTSVYGLCKLCTLPFSLHKVFFKMCIQVSNFNEIKNFYCFFRTLPSETGFWNYKCTAVRNTMTTWPSGQCAWIPTKATVYVSSVSLQYIAITSSYTNPKSKYNFNHHHFYNQYCKW